MTTDMVKQLQWTQQNPNFKKKKMEKKTHHTKGERRLAAIFILFHSQLN